MAQPMEAKKHPVIPAAEYHRETAKHDGDLNGPIENASSASRKSSPEEATDLRLCRHEMAHGMADLIQGATLATITDEGDFWRTTHAGLTDDVAIFGLGLLDHWCRNA